MKADHIERDTAAAARVVKYGMNSDERQKGAWSCRKGRLEDLNRDFDYQFWQQQSPIARFAAAWELVREYHLGILGEDEDKLRLQRSAVALKRREG